MGLILGIVVGTFAGAFLLLLLGIRHLIYICAPNEVLIFSGSRRRVIDRNYGYRIVKGGRGIRKPLMERVDRMDLTNMIIDLSISNAYSKGGVPLNVHGVANMKIAGHEPVLNNAIERFLGKSRTEIASFAKSTLEGSLRGILATMTPEEINEDKILFAERLVQEVEEDMTRLGLVIDTFKIQNVQDDSGYLDSIGRKKNAEVVRAARIAEAIAHADAAVRTAENRESEVRAQITAQVEVAKADAQRRLTDALTRRDALVAEEQATVAASLAQAKAEIPVQTARLEQVKRRLEADVIAPARAQCESAEAAAKARAQPIVADGEARAEVLRSLAARWKDAGPHARDVFLLQKLDKVIGTVTDIVAEKEISSVTMIDSRGGASLPAKAIGTVEAIRSVFGVDLIELLKSRTATTSALPADGAVQESKTYDTPEP